MDWTNGMTSSYYVMDVDPTSWLDTNRREILSGEIDRTPDGLQTSASLEMSEVPSSWIRIYMVAEQDGVERVPLFTGLATSPERELDGQRQKRKVTCYSVLTPASKKTLDRGYYIPANVDAPRAVKKLLDCTPAPIKIADADHPKLLEAVIAEDNETALSMACKVLDGIGWTYMVNGEGVIELSPKSQEVKYTIDADHDILGLQVTDSKDVFDVPNILRCTYGDMVAEARDDDPESELSTISRGFEVWEMESEVILGDNESLQSYTRKRLKELQTPARTISYNRRFIPELFPGDIIRINYPAEGLDGFFKITSQSFELTHGSEVAEQAQEVVV